MKKIVVPLLFAILVISCNSEKSSEDKKETPAETSSVAETKQFPTPQFTLAEANKLLELPLNCMETEYPNKLGQTIGGSEDLQPPKQLHPIFYGCFDWHSAVHGYWSVVTLLKHFPELEKAEIARALLQKNITKENVAIEIQYFNKPLNKSYERTYGWAWLLKLTEELHTWDNPLARELEENLLPLTNLIVERYIEFLPKLVYPIRVGEHTNTAFGLSFAYDYADTLEHEALKNAIAKRANEFYIEDTNCNLDWEPSGYDFLSPCLEEINIMRRVLSEDDFKNWLDSFMPELKDKNYSLAVGEVSDRTDGKLVHLDGLNFSRAWVFYGLAKQYPEYRHLVNNANEHIAYSYPNLVGDSYEGGHWLGSFAIYALTQVKN